MKPMKEVWIVGVTTEGGWMAEGVFLTEKDAADAAKENEFIVLVDVGERIPEDATNAKRLYWPHRETWEQSALFRLQERRPIAN